MTLTALNGLIFTALFLWIGILAGPRIFFSLYGRKIPSSILFYMSLIYPFYGALIHDLAGQVGRGTIHFELVILATLFFFGVLPGVFRTEELQGAAEHAAYWFLNLVLAGVSGLLCLGLLIATIWMG